MDEESDEKLEEINKLTDPHMQYYSSSKGEDKT
jgi:hypothetical protein